METMEKKSKFVSDEEFKAALESMRPWWDEAMQIKAISDESARRAKSRDFITRWSTFRNNTIGNAWGRIYPSVIAAAISGKKPLETVRMLLEKHQVRLAAAWKQGCELTGIEPPLHDEIARRDYEGSVPAVVELLGALRKKLDEIRAAKPVVESDDFVDELLASADTEIEKRIKWTKDVLFDYDREEGDFDAANRRQKRERIQEKIQARKDARQPKKIEKGRTANEVLAPVPENTPVGNTSQPVPDPHVELESRIKDLETAFASAKTNVAVVVATQSEGDSTEKLTSAIAEVQKIAAELKPLRAELEMLNTPPQPQPVPDPRVELESRMKELGVRMATAKAARSKAADDEDSDEEALIKAMAEVKKIAVELTTARAELEVLNTPPAVPLAVMPKKSSLNLLDEVLTRVGDFVPPEITKEDVQKALEAFVASAESNWSDPANSATRMVKKFLGDPNKRPNWIVDKALNASSRRKTPIVASASSA